jgi:hypothetical protein
MDNEKTVADQEQAAVAKIQILIGKTKADANPDELERLKKLIKKNVPFTLRGYFMAYLLREAMAGGYRPENRPQRQPRAPRPQQQAEQASPAPQAEGEQAEESAERAPREQKPLPEGARTLYLNIGKMKRLYSKELSQIFQDKLGITRDDIYSIRIHDKYSFVAMSQENCEKAIAQMNGMDIKGRTVSVSYSNKE